MYRNIYLKCIFQEKYAIVIILVFHGLPERRAQGPWTQGRHQGWFGSGEMGGYKQKPLLQLLGQNGCRGMKGLGLASINNFCGLYIEGHWPYWSRTCGWDREISEIAARKVGAWQERRRALNRAALRQEEPFLKSQKG